MTYIIRCLEKTRKRIDNKYYPSAAFYLVVEPSSSYPIMVFCFFFFNVRAELSMLLFCAQHKTSRLAKTLPRRHYIHLNLTLVL